MKDITPEHLRCAAGHCPAIFDNGDGTLTIIGKVLHDIPDMVAQKIGNGETAVVISKDYFTEMPRNGDSG